MQAEGGGSGQRRLWLFVTSLGIFASSGEEENADEAQWHGRVEKLGWGWGCAEAVKGDWMKEGKMRFGRVWKV